MELSFADTGDERFGSNCEDIVLGGCFEEDCLGGRRGGRAFQSFVII